MKSSIHVISQENMDKAFHLDKHNYFEKTNLLKIYFCLKDNKNHDGGFLSNLTLHVY